MNFMGMNNGNGTHDIHEPDDDWDRVIAGDGQHGTGHGRLARNIIITVTALAVSVTVVSAMVFGAGRVRTMLEERNHPAPSREISMSKDYTDPSGAANPASGVSYAGKSQDTSVSIDHRKITMTSKRGSTIIEIPALTADIVAQPCTLKDRAATCYLGASRQGDRDIDIYAFRDASTSSLLMTTEKPLRENVKGAAIAYRQKVIVGDDKDMMGYVIINPDQTGLLMTGHGLGGGIGSKASVTVHNHADDDVKRNERNEDQ